VLTHGKASGWGTAVGSSSYVMHKKGYAEDAPSTAGMWGNFCQAGKGSQWVDKTHVVISS